MGAVSENLVNEILKLSRRLNTRSSRNEMDSSSGQGMVLSLITNNDGSCLRKIAELAGISEPTAAEFVDKLEKLGFVQRQKSSEDRRKTALFVTHEGKMKAEQLVGASESLFGENFPEISDDDLKIAEDTIRSLNAALAQRDASSERSAGRTVSAARRKKSNIADKSVSSQNVVSLSSSDSHAQTEKTAEPALTGSQQRQPARGVRL